MKIRVVHKDGRIETLTLGGAVECREGHELDRLVASDGEHFFTKDGYYDGWGRAVLATPADAARLRATIETLREIDDPPTA
jgi:hypothetical protein